MKDLFLKRMAKYSQQAKKIFLTNLMLKNYILKIYISSHSPFHDFYFERYYVLTHNPLR